MTSSWYVGNPTFRKFEGDKRTYYVPTDIYINAADNILVDTHDPNSRGFGGSKFAIATTEGKDDHVKGPWHGTVPYSVCDVTELHFTKVTLIARPEWVDYKDWAVLRQEHGRECECIVCRFRMIGEILYDENEMVLGAFYRGDRVAQQLADLRQETLYVHVETSGGSHSHFCKPGGNLHPLAHRSEDNDLSAEQGGVVYG